MYLHYFVLRPAQAPAAESVATVGTFYVHHHVIIPFLKIRLQNQLLLKVHLKHLPYLITSARKHTRHVPGFSIVWVTFSDAENLFQSLFISSAFSNMAISLSASVQYVSNALIASASANVSASWRSLNLRYSLLCVSSHTFIFFLLKNPAPGILDYIWQFSH